MTKTKTNMTKEEVIKAISPFQFSHLHLHTKASPRDGIISNDKLIERAKKLGINSVAITDHGTISGWVDFEKECTRNSIKPIYGCEAYVNIERKKLFKIRDIIDCPVKHRFDKCPDNKCPLYHKFKTKGKCITKEQLDKLKKVRKSLRKANHLILLAKSRTGYSNIIKIINDAYLNGFYYNSMCGEDFIKKHKDGVICSSACLGSAFSKAIVNNYEEGVKKIQQYKVIFGDDFYIEIMPIDMEEQFEVNKLLIKAAKETNTRFIFTKDCHYLDEAEGKTHALLLAMKTRDSKNEEKVWKFEANDLYFCDKNTLANEIMTKHSYIDYEDIVEGFKNIDDLLSKIELFSVDRSIKIPTIENSKNILINYAKDELIKRGLHKKKNYVDRLIHEIKVIENMGFMDYFYIVWDYCEFCKKEGIMHGPRGSGAGSLFCYLLGITTPIDPIQYGLMFERFLNEDRVQKKLCLEI